MRYAPLVAEIVRRNQLTGLEEILAQKSLGRRGLILRGQAEVFMSPGVLTLSITARAESKDFVKY